jgi:hypothetical protein
MWFAWMITIEFHFVGRVVLSRERRVGVGVETTAASAERE